MPSRDPLTKGEKRKLSRLRSDLLAWASTNGRSFPWRSKEAGDYEMIVAEVLLQRTTATAVANFFDAFTEKYPGWNDLAAAHTADLEQFLRPLGLWRRRSVRSSVSRITHQCMEVSFPKLPRSTAISRRSGSTSRTRS